MPSTSDDTRFWDRAARKYAGDPIKDMAGYERTLERARQLLGASDRVLEVGCGTGTTALLLAPAVGRIEGTDVSGEMIAIARGKAAAQAFPNAEFTVAPAEQAPGADGSFDAVLAFSLLHLLGDRPAMFRNAYRLLRPGGLLISKTPCLSEMNVLVRLAIPVMQLVGKAPYVAVFGAEQLESEIADAGFTIVERARHGSERKDFRIFIVARKPIVG